MKTKWAISVEVNFYFIDEAEDNIAINIIKNRCKLKSLEMKHEKTLNRLKLI